MGQAGAERSEVTRGAKSRAWGRAAGGLFDLLACDGGAILGLARIRRGQDLGGLFLWLFGLFVAFVLFLGHVALPVCAGKAAKGAGRARKTSGAGRKMCGAEPVGSRWGFG